MNKAVVVFVIVETLIKGLTEHGIRVSGSLLLISLLVLPATRVTISSVPAFIPDADIKRGLSRFGKFADAFEHVIPLLNMSFLLEGRCSCF